MDIPVWILVLVGGIIISAFMAVKVGREEREEEREIIEREGEVYMERLKKEKEERSEGSSFG
ncbi:sporulation YhaL family protein [Robertmurraya kyonggiensis]|uniref:SigE-dependent sporulation protein n=1 Tax=Robertmurraya kyonggiensis TaxID=1037680 RepID=A0A4U1D6S5_9BACI|nr:sporulation YhaL family protein [Robertmurraya kyonggiensis]TKC18154.1 SigE-dependent sporulation protein [Robertmurraya kyonggiensis]